jgi:hypothetical protein
VVLVNIITLDFETYFDDEYTLSKMTTEAYVRDPRFEAHGCAIWDHSLGGSPAWFDEYTDRDIGASLSYQLRAIDWANTAVLCHHTHFDGLILSHHYGIKPAMYLDTLSMARALLGTHISKSLESLAKEFGLGAKTVPYNLFKGKHWHEIAPDVQRQVAQGACDDVELTWNLFRKLAAGFSEEEYALVDATVRMFTAPVLVGDTELLGQIWREEAAKKSAMLAELGVTEADIRKDHVFTKLLRAHGVEPPQKRMKDGKCKVCKGTGQVSVVPDTPGYQEDCTECEGSGEVKRWKYAFAKTDDFMRELQEDADEDVRLLVETKLAAHSNGTQTRTARLGDMSVRGAMCVYLNYCGAHTKRWSGGDKVNWQNLKRGGPIARTIRASRGALLVINDASQIECRILNEVAGQEDVVERFRAHADPYVALASTFYGEQIYKPKKGDPREAEMEAKRGTGKQGELSCGYGAGGPTIKATAKKGTYGPPVLLSDEEALRLRDTYRSTHPHVVRLWKDAGDVLKKLHGGLEFEWECMYVKDKRIYLPNGLPLIYDTLKWEDDPDDGGDAGWRVKVNKNGWSRMYGAKLVENVIQALARLHVSQAWIRCKQAGLDMVSMEHDKLIAVVRESEAEAAFAFMREEMSRPPVWLPNVPLDSEGYISDTFAKPDGNYVMPMRR